DAARLRITARPAERSRGLPPTTATEAGANTESRRQVLMDRQYRAAGGPRMTARRERRAGLRVSASSPRATTTSCQQRPSRHRTWVCDDPLPATQPLQHAVERVQVGVGDHQLALVGAAVVDADLGPERFGQLVLQRRDVGCGGLAGGLFLRRTRQLAGGELRRAVLDLAHR